MKKTITLFSLKAQNTRLLHEVGRKLASDTIMNEVIFKVFFF